VSAWRLPYPDLPSLYIKQHCYPEEYVIRLKIKRAVVLTALAATASLLTLSQANRLNAQETARPAEATIEQKHKNIQALKGIPNSQLFPIMNLFNASLGVDCAFCHVKNGDQWEWDKDDKKHKQDARRMIQLTMEMNNKFFNGRPQVSCFTCHLGEEHPRGVPPLPQKFEPQTEATAGAPTTGWPTPQQILDKYTQAVGGQQAVARLSTRWLKGTYLTARGQSFPFEAKIAGPEKWVWMMSVPGGQTVGMNGAVTWLRTERENRPMTPVELSRFSSQARSLEPLQIIAPYPRLNFGGKEKIGEHEAWVLRGQTADKKRVRYSFDTRTGLLLRRMVISDTVVGQDPEQIDYEDYRDVEGVKIPFTIRSSYLDAYFTSTRRLTEVKSNAKVDEAQFTPPAK
jgi:hypothetical protein